jgi:hypothetical protein
MRIQWRKASATTKARSMACVMANWWSKVCAMGTAKWTASSTACATENERSMARSWAFVRSTAFVSANRMANARSMACARQKAT